MRLSYGVREQTSTADQFDVHAEAVRRAGFTIVPGEFPAETLDEWRDRLDQVHSGQSAAAGGADQLRAIGEADVVRALFCFDEAFLDVLRSPNVLEIARRLLGDYFIVMLQNGIVNPPSDVPHHQSAYHRDLPYQHWVSSRPLSVNALFCLDEFTPEAGSTFILPASHKDERFPSDSYIAENEIGVTAPAGSYIVFDSMLYHRAGINSSKVQRRAINQVYCLPFLKQQIVLPAVLGGKWSDDPELSRLLGYESDPPRSLEEWLEGRRKRASAGSAAS